MDLLEFRQALLRWFQSGHRDLPWRKTKNPYAIWLSEIMLQQTRAAAVIPYYQQFLRRFPTPEALAAAPESEVLAAWSGLGYYSRARNLRKAAEQIVSGGGFPRNYDAIRALPGIGPYTAAAVASIAFDLPHAVLDGNVLRVVARIENDRSDIALPATQRKFQRVADQWLDQEHSGAFNQAVMELGATVCVPRTPLCLLCPVAAYCGARQAGREDQLPVKKRKAAPELVEATAVLVQRDHSVLMRQRPAASKRMAGFWELPSEEHLPGVVLGKPLGKVQHTIVNQCHTFTVFPGKWTKKQVPAGMEWLNESRFGEVPVTTVTRKALRLLESCKSSVKSPLRRQTAKASRLD